MSAEGLATEEEQQEFFLQILEGFMAASARTGEIVRDFRVAGTSVRLRFAGEALIPSLVPGLANPVSDLVAGRTLEICVWDSESSRIQLAPPPRSRKDFTERGNIWGFDSSRFRSAYHWGEASLSVMDRESLQAVFWAPSSRNLPAWVLASPLRSILHWWMELNGRQLVHAAAIGFNNRSVLMPGRGGSGKSSTSLACLLAGLDFIADDYLAMALDPEPRAYRLYSTAKLHPQALNRYPELAARCRTVYQPGFDKVVLFLEDGFGKQLRDSLPINLVLKPTISGVPETTFGTVDPQNIERALASETLAHLPHVNSSTVHFLDRVSREIPRASIDLGTDHARLASAIKEVLNGVITPSYSDRPVGNRRPFVSMIVHFHENEPDELRALAAHIEAQDYPRTELIVMASGPARALTDERPELSGNVRFFSYKDPVPNAEAWNRGVRESFSDLVILIEPEDRFAPGAIEILVTECEENSKAAWVRGASVSSRLRSDSISPLRGALIRKLAFRECGLFAVDPFLQGKEHLDWLKICAEKGLTAHELERVTLYAERAALVQSCVMLPNVALRFLQSHLERTRKVAKPREPGH